MNCSIFAEITIFDKYKEYMVISDKKFVAVSYDLFVGDEGEEQELMEQAPKEAPLKFTFGLGMMIESFEKGLEGKAVGEKFDFTIEPQDAYGDYEDGRVVELDKAIFEVDGKFDTDMIFEGNTVPMMDAEGNRMNGTILEISKDKVKMDFNHPLAGERLHFVGEVLEVRDATPEEIAVATMPHSCGGGCCGDCGDGDCGGGCSGCGCGEH